MGWIHNASHIEASLTTFDCSNSTKALYLPKLERKKTVGVANGRKTKTKMENVHENREQRTSINKQHKSSLLNYFSFTSSMAKYEQKKLLNLYDSTSLPPHRPRALQIKNVREFFMDQKENEFIAIRTLISAIWFMNGKETSLLRVNYWAFCGLSTLFPTPKQFFELALFKIFKFCSSWKFSVVIQTDFVEVEFQQENEI